ncbi:hypothetical protein AAFF_G00369200 [Aldrovandia affinis]|uniref:Uncharacterized protein n=1 Tax=Aldrovandia affinis TaxID=143900 RepID=A0AAD7WME7_9TELE|nr:hypothetical protein AAFF_G00369200 [Aldrovandia affinis]
MVLCCLQQDASAGVIKQHPKIRYARSAPLTNIHTHKHVKVLAEHLRDGYADAWWSRKPASCAPFEDKIKHSPEKSAVCPAVCAPCALSVHYALVIICRRSAPQHDSSS